MSSRLCGLTVAPTEVGLPLRWAPPDPGSPWLSGRAPPEPEAQSAAGGDGLSVTASHVSSPDCFLRESNMMQM